MHNVIGRDGLAMLRADESDLVVGSMLEVPDDIRYTPFVTYRPTLITSNDHPLASKEIITLRGYRAPWLDSVSEVSEHLAFGRSGLQAASACLPRHARGGGWQMIKKRVELGLGISIVTDVCLTGDEALHRAPLDHCFPWRSYGIVQRRGKLLSPQAKRFLNVL